MLKRFRSTLQDYKELLATVETKNVNVGQAMNSGKYVYDYNFNKAKYLGDNMKRAVADLRKVITELYTQSTNPELGEQYSKMMVQVRLLEEKYYDPVRSRPIIDNIEKMLKPLEQDEFVRKEIEEVEAEVSKTEKTDDSEDEETKDAPEIEKPESIKSPELPGIDLPFLPVEIKTHIMADINELEKCYNLGCYRSAIILCGRLLETALHRKYFEVTGNDALEKNPGIGLGKLVAKLNEQNVTFDPGLMNQVHLINQMRISSVHVKKDLYKPNQNQTQAAILYTLDVLHKMFSK